MVVTTHRPRTNPPDPPTELVAASPWRDAQLGTWFDAGRPSPTIEIVLENVGARSWLRSLLTTLTSQYGTQQCRFVAREDDTGLGSVDHAVSGSFPVLALQLPDDRFDSGDAWGEEAVDRLSELEQRLRQDGWQLIGQGAHWWSKIFTRHSAGAPTS